MPVEILTTDPRAHADWLRDARDASLRVLAA
jgi:hypothetical protein